MHVFHGNPGEEVLHASGSLKPAGYSAARGQQHSVEYTHCAGLGQEDIKRSEAGAMIAFCDRGNGL